MKTLFDLRNVSYSYLGNIDALKDISLKINPGEQVSIIGTNGCGKSTLLSLLDALIYPTSGELYALDHMITEDLFDSMKDNNFRSYFRKRVGFIFQNSDIQLFSSTVYDEIAFGPMYLDISHEEIKARVDDIMEMIEIGKLSDRSPHTLSGGEKKRVCLASVLVNNPDVLLLDEPTAGLDPRTQFWLTELLQELGDAGKTVITATHDLNIIEKISKRSIVMGEDHTIRKDGGVTEILSDYDLLLNANLIQGRAQGLAKLQNVRHAALRLRGY